MTNITNDNTVTIKGVKPRRTIIGILRPIDKLGRIVIPKELRTAFGMDVMDQVEIIGTTDGLLIRKYNENNNICIFCDTETESTHAGKFVCDDCKLKIKKECILK